VSVDPSLEAPRQGRGERFSDAVTVAFADQSADVQGVARLGLAGGAASGLVLLFSGGRPVAVTAAGDAPAPETGDWDSISAAGLRTAVVAPLREWTLAYAGEEASFDLRVHATGEPAALPADHPAAKAGGMTGYDQLVRVEGTVTVDGRRLAVDALGQRGHAWGEPDWSRMALARTVSVWLDADLGVTLTAVRPAKASAHGNEVVAATLVEDGAPLPVADARLSTTYDGEGRQRHAGLELWMAPEDDRARRAAGEVVAGTTLDLGRLRLDAAFFRWHMDGREGVGRYDVLRRAA
jgi:hypothetical protein